jgi:predicted permease
MDQENFSPRQSLELIETMISKAKNSVADSSVYFLLWGWVVFVACITQYILKNVVKYERHDQAWFLVIIGIVGSIYLGIKEG